MAFTAFQIPVIPYTIGLDVFSFQLLIRENIPVSHSMTLPKRSLFIFVVYCFGLQVLVFPFLFVTGAKRVFLNAVAQLRCMISLSPRLIKNEKKKKNLPRTRKTIHHRLGDSFCLNGAEPKRAEMVTFSVAFSFCLFFFSSLLRSHTQTD